MNESFADSFYFIALLNPYDQHHAAVLDATSRLDTRLETTHWVLMEVADALSHPHARARAARFLRTALVDSEMTIVSDLQPWFDAGLEIYEQRGDKSWSLTDCIQLCSHEGAEHPRRTYWGSAL